MIYTFLTFLFFFAASPFLILLSLKDKFKFSIPARFFLKDNKKFEISNFHFHACSLGEVVAIEPFFRACDGSRISVTTKTGFDRASNFTKNVKFLPFECFLPFWLSSCKTLVVFEAELWLNLFRTAKKNGSKTILLNARISDHSYKSYLRFGFYYRWVFSYIDLVLAQSDIDKIRLENLGAKNVKVVGNVKSANIPNATKAYQKPQNRVITIASSHEKEEERLLENLEFKKGDKLLISPRHPERFEKVGLLAANFAKKFNLKFAKFSNSSNFFADVVLIDKMGELINIYSISDIVIICGSFEKGIGGHNPLEAAQFCCKMISGKFIHNQISLFEIVDGVKFIDYTDINTALNSELDKTKIKNRSNFEEILKEIKEI